MLPAGIHTDDEPGLPNPADEPRARLLVGGAPRGPRDAARRVLADRRERLDVPAQPLEVDPESVRGHPSASPDAVAAAERGVPSGRKQVASSASTVAPTPSQKTRPIP